MFAKKHGVISGCGLIVLSSSQFTLTSTYLLGEVIRPNSDTSMSAMNDIMPTIRAGTTDGRVSLLPLLFRNLRKTTIAEIGSIKLSPPKPSSATLLVQFVLFFGGEAQHAIVVNQFRPPLHGIN